MIDGPLDQRTGGYLYDRLVIDGLRARGVAVDVRSLDAGGTRAAIAESLRMTAELARLGAEPGRTVVIDELCHPRVALAALVNRARGSNGARLVALVHHLAASERTGARAAARWAVESALIHAAETVIATSETTSNVLSAAGVSRERMRVVRPGRDRLGERLSPRERWNGGDVKLFFVGAIAPRKGVLELIEAFGAVSEEATLTLVGPADRAPAYAARVHAAAAGYTRSGERPARMRVLGEIGDAALARELAEHDVLVLPSRYEGFGIVLAEALSHGLAVVASTAGAIPEVVRDGAEAILVSPGDGPALASALRRVVREHGLRAEMQTRALERARELPTWRETKQAFAEALGARRG